ncbi:MAG TPA: hypothetical protein VF556_14655 [Pyrinomonadaceae bacterium]|jgi:hypothetical protein
MNIFDFLIIYLACGAPVSVYLHFQNRRLYSKQSWLKTVLYLVFWIPFFVQIILKSRMFKDFLKFSLNSKKKLDIDKDNQVLLVQKKIENILSENDANISVYEFREVFERFVGLTKASANYKNEPFEHEKEFFRVSKKGNQELSSKCLHRRNQKRLYFHHTEAEKDFLQMITRISDSVIEQAELRRTTIELSTLLNNSKIRAALTEMFDSKSQIIPKTAVKDLEKDLWMPELHKPPAVNHISTNWRITREKVNLSAKD